MVILYALHSLSLSNEVIHEGLDFTSEHFRISNWFENYEKHQFLVVIDRHGTEPLW